MVFKVSSPTNQQVEKDVERVVAVFLVAAFGFWLATPDKFSKATAVGAWLAGVTAVYGLVKSTLTTL